MVNKMDEFIFDDQEDTEKSIVSGAKRRINTFKKGRALQQSPVDIQRVKISQLQSNPYQPRFTNDVEIYDLMEQINNTGGKLLQPITIAPVEESADRYYIVAGHRRTEAYKKLGKTEIECHFREVMSDAELRTSAIIENQGRESLKSIELAVSIEQGILAKHYKNVNDAAKQIGMDRSKLAKIYKLLELPDVIKMDLVQNRSTTDVLALDKIRQINNDAIAIEVYQWFISKEGSRKGLQNYIDEKLGGSNLEAKPEQHDIEVSYTGESTIINIPMVLDKDVRVKIIDYINQMCR